jgi:small subunit ribosomal protein S2
MLSLYYNYFCKTGFHFGGIKTKDKRVNFQNYPAFLGKRSNLMVIDLKQTLYSLRVSLFFLTKIITLRGKTLGIENREFLRSFFIYFFSKSRHFYFHKKWLAGFLTNFRYFRAFVGMVQRRDAAAKLLEEYEDYFTGVTDLKIIPTFIVFTQTSENLAAHSEAARLGIPNISFYDFFDDTSGITFPVPGEVSSEDSVYFLGRLFYGAILMGSYKEIFFFFRKNLYFNKLNREKFLTRASYYILGDRYLGLKKKFLRKFYRPKFQIAVRKKKLKKKLIRIFLRRKKISSQFYRSLANKIFLREKNSNLAAGFNNLRRLAKLNYYPARFPFALKLLLLFRRRSLKNLNFLSIEYLKVKFPNFKYSKKMKFFKNIKFVGSKRKFKNLRLKKTHLKRFGFGFKSLYSTSFKLISSLFQKHQLKYEKAFFLLGKRLSFENRIVGGTMRFSKFIKVKKKKRKLKLKLKLKRKRRKTKLTILKYLIRFFIYRRFVVLNSALSPIRSKLSLKKFEHFGSRRLRTFLTKKYLIKKRLLHKINANIYRLK